jgi:hypothetical protein
MYDNGVGRYKTKVSFATKKVSKDSITRKIGDSLVAKSTCVDPRHSLHKICETYLYAYANKLKKVPTLQTRLDLYNSELALASSLVLL